MIGQVIRIWAGLCREWLRPEGWYLLGHRYDITPVCLHLSSEIKDTSLHFFCSGIRRRYETSTQCSWGSWDAWDEYVRTSYYTNKYWPNNKDYFLLSRTIVNEDSLSITGVPEEDRGQIHQIPTRWVVSPTSRCEMSATAAVGKCLHLKSIWLIDFLSVLSVWSDPRGI